MAKVDSDGLFLMSWYLDVVSPNWRAIVWGDYESAFPLTLISRLGIDQVFQPIFTREFKVLGASIPIANVLKIIESNFKYLNIRFGEKFNSSSLQIRTHQQLFMNQEIQLNYSTNAKRLVKKSNKQYTYVKASDLDPFFKLIEETLIPKIKEFNANNIAKLKRLMTEAQRENKGDCYAVMNATNELIGAGFFLKHAEKITYLKGSVTDEGKKQGAMFGLFDFAFNHYSDRYKVFDFGGSDVKNVANFYHKFGASDRIYYHYEINNLPFWYRWIKTLANYKKGK